MIEPTIYGLSNEQYHFGEEERHYLSSSLLKKYLISPKAYKHAIDNPQGEKSDALRFGSLFHDLMASCAEHYDNGPLAITEWLRGIAVFEPPVNESRGTPYTPASKPYKEAYEAFLTANEGKTIASQDEVDTATDMAMSLIGDSGATSEQVRKLLKWGKPEVSHFIEYEGCRFKWRPDLETRRKIVDWKTVSTDDLSEESINRIILKYGYHISAAFYQFFEHERTGVWKQFILVLVSKVPPYDCVMIDMENYCFSHNPLSGDVKAYAGAMEFMELLQKHIQCVEQNEWPGAESSIPIDKGVRILKIKPPKYYTSRYYPSEE